MKKLFLVLLIIFLYGCASPQILTHTKAGANFSKYMKVGVMRFVSAEPSVGQEISDFITLHLMKRGYNVAERSQIQAIIDESIIVGAGLTDKDKSVLKLGGVDILIVGSVTRYDCEQSRFVVPTAYGPAGGTKNLCHASMSLKMVDVQNGEVLWAGQGSHSLKGRSMTAGKVLQEILERMGNQIPIKNP